MWSRCQCVLTTYLTGSEVLLWIQRRCSRDKRTLGASTTSTAFDPMITVAFPSGRPSVVLFGVNAKMPGATSVGVWARRSGAASRTAISTCLFTFKHQNGGLASISLARGQRQGFEIW